MWESSAGQTPRIGIAGSKAMCVYNFDSYCQVPLHKSYTLMNDIKVCLFPLDFLQKCQR